MVILRMFVLVVRGNVFKTSGHVNKTVYSSGELLHADLIGPLNKSYALVCIDHNSKFITGSYLTRKSQASSSLIAIINKLNSILKYNNNKSICYIRTDNEFRTKEMNTFCEQNGINPEFTAPHSSYQNGNAENANKQLKIKMRILMIDSGLPKHLWFYALTHAIFLLNYIPRNKETESAWEKFSGKKKEIRNLLPFGCLIFYYNYINEQKIFTKYQSGIFIGYDNTTQIALIYDGITHKIVRSSAFQGFPNSFPLRKSSWYEHAGAVTDSSKFLAVDDLDNENEPISSSHIGKYGGSFLSSWSDSLDVPPPGPSSSSDGLIQNIPPPSVSAEPEQTHRVTIESVPDTDRMDTDSDDNGTNIDTDVDNNDVNDVTEMTKDLVSSNLSTENKLVHTQYEKESPQPVSLSSQKLKSNSNCKSQQRIMGSNTPPQRILEYNKPPQRLLPSSTISEDNTALIPSNNLSQELIKLNHYQNEQSEKVTNQLIAMNQKNQEQSNTLLQHLTTLQNQQQDKLMQHFTQFMGHNSQPIYIPVESDLLHPNSNTTSTITAPPLRPLLNTRGDVATELIPRPPPGEVVSSSSSNAADNSSDIDIDIELPPDSSPSPSPSHDHHVSRSSLNPILERYFKTTTKRHTNPLPTPTTSSKRTVRAGPQYKVSSTQPDGSERVIATRSTKIHRHVDNPIRNTEISEENRTSNSDVVSTNSQFKGGNSLLNQPDEVNLLVNKLKYEIPNTYKQAMNTPQAKQWKMAAMDEYKSMIDNKVFKSVNRKDIPKNALIVKSRWVFNVKQEENNTERFKARIVAKGFTQERGVNYIDKYAPVMRFETLKLVFSLAAMNKWNIRQLDAKNAFLNGKLDHQVFLEPPEGTTKTSNTVWKLIKSLYGLKQSPRIWYLTIAKVLKENGYQNSIIDPCLFWKKGILLTIYVDDILITGCDEKTIESAVKMFKANFTMKDMGKPKMFLGITINEIPNSGYELSMKDSIENMKENFNITPTQRKLITPIAKGYDKNEDNSPQLNNIEHSKYRSIVGTLLYMANTVRLDISFAVSYLSRFLEKPTEYLMKAAYRVIQYVIQTKDFSLKYQNKKQELNYKDFRYIDKTEDIILHDYPNETKFKLTVISDSDWAGDIKDRKSQSGHIVLFNGNIIDWTSRKQEGTSGSSTESEYIALSEAIKSGMSIYNMLKEMKINVSYINLVGDNCSALTLAAHNTLHKRTKHIDLKYHYIRELVNSKKVKLNYINTKENIADMLTKFMDTTTSTNLIKLINSK